MRGDRVRARGAAGTHGGGAGAGPCRDDLGLVVGTGDSRIPSLPSETIDPPREKSLGGQADGPACDFRSRRFLILPYMMCRTVRLAGGGCSLMRRDMRFLVAGCPSLPPAVSLTTPSVLWLRRS